MKKVIKRHFAKICSNLIKSFATFLLLLLFTLLIFLLFNFHLRTYLATVDLVGLLMLRFTIIINIKTVTTSFAFRLTLRFVF